MSKRALRALKKYPTFYLLRCTFSYGLFAHEGKHRGSCLGVLHDGGSLELYGAENFAKRGGLAWQHHPHERFIATSKEIKAAAVWVGERAAKASKLPRVREKKIKEK